MPRGALPIHGRAIHPAAFTLVELILCIGVVAVLVGLALPLLGRVQAHSREARDLAQIYQGGAVTTAYMQDHGEIFPVGDPLALRAIRMWTSPLVAGGYLPDARAADPGGYTRAGVSESYNPPA